MQVIEISQSTWKTGEKGLTFEAFGEIYNLLLQPSHLLAPQVDKLPMGPASCRVFSLQAVVVKRQFSRRGNTSQERLSAVEDDPECHFLMKVGCHSST